MLRTVLDMFYRVMSAALDKFLSSPLTESMSFAREAWFCSLLIDMIEWGTLTGAKGLSYGGSLLVELERPC